MLVRALFSRRRVAAGVVLAAAALVVTSCTTTPAGQAVENTQQQGVTANLVAAQPIPNIPYSQMRANLVELETAQAKGVQTTSFIMQRASPDPIQVCPSIGVPIPNTASLSNPTQLTITSGGGHDGVIDQMDPNGLYAPTSSQGTYVMCIGADGIVTPVYAEGEVHTVFGPATWDYGKHQVQITGPASFTFSKAPR